MPIVQDINVTESWIIDTTLKECQGNEIESQIADSEIRLSPADRDLTQCPFVIWQADTCNFVAIKTGDHEYGCQFFYRNYPQYGTGVSEYDDLTEYVVPLLQAQTDHTAKERGDI